MQSYDPLKRNSFSPKGMWGAGSSPCHFSCLYPKASRKTAPPARIGHVAPGWDAVPGSEPFQLPRPPPATRLGAPGQVRPAGGHRSGAELSRGSGDLRPHTPSTNTLTDTHSWPRRRGGHDPRKWIPAWRAPRRGGVDRCRPDRSVAAAAGGLAPTAGRRRPERPL